ncbi:MAG: serine/threonine-protein kinase [Polyangia bacterium]
MGPALQIAEQPDGTPPGVFYVPSVGDSIGPYRVLEQLGQGGMAVVYRARLRGGEGKDVVVKSMLPHLATMPALVEMFEAEARLTSQLRHPNIVRVENHGVHAGTPYLTMELLDGRNLSQLRLSLARSKRRMPLPIAVRIAHDLAVALGCAHAFVDRSGCRMQIIHRDVSPSNVMVERDGTVKLLDFGVARLSSEAGHIITQSLKGKFAYMAPEQVNQAPIDRRCDVFAAGIVLHEMLTGRRLFATKDELETLRRVSLAEAAPPSTLNSAVSPELDRIVMRALSLRAEDRFDSGTELAVALASLGPLASQLDIAEFVVEVSPAEPKSALECASPLIGDEQIACSIAYTDARDTDALPIGPFADAEHDVPSTYAKASARFARTDKVEALSFLAVDLDVEELIDRRTPPRWDLVVVGLAVVAIVIALAIGLS